MVLDLTPADAEILIAVLLYAEGMALADNPPILSAIEQLRPFRSALIQTYLHTRFAPATEPVTSCEVRS